MKNNHKQEGFSIFELLIVVVIVIAIGVTGYFIYKDDSSKHQPSLENKSTTSTSMPKQTTSNNSVNSASLDWIVQYHFLSLVQANSAAMNEFSKSPKIYAILSDKEAKNGFNAISGLNIVPTVYYNSYTKFVDNYNNHNINSQVKAVVFDDSSDTPSSVVPTAEAANPYQYDQLITQFAHQHGMISMCDFILGKRIGNKQGEAPPCDVVLLNYSQQSERSPQKYASVVNKALAVVDAKSPQLPLIAGLSTNPRGTPITASELVNAVNATSSKISGYWISIPTSGKIGCPNCSQQNPSLLPAFLAQLDT